MTIEECRVFAALLRTIDKRKGAPEGAPITSCNVFPGTVAFFLYGKNGASDGT